MIVEMKHLDLVCVASERDATLERLRGLGAVHLDLSAAASAPVAEAQGVSEVALSLSFTHEVATAMALLVTDEVRPQPKEERDPERELRTSFKEARSVIDELERLQGDVAATLE